MFVFCWWRLCRRCTSDWYYVIGTSPRSARSKLRFLSFCDQNPWKDVKSSIVFFEFVSIDDLTFRRKQEKIRVTGTLKRSLNIHFLPQMRRFSLTSHFTFTLGYFQLSQIQSFLSCSLTVGWCGCNCWFGYDGTKRAVGESHWNCRATGVYKTWSPIFFSYCMNYIKGHLSLRYLQSCILM